MTWFDHLLILFVTVLMPYMGWRNYPKFLEMVRQQPAAARRSVYISNMVALWVLALIVLMMWQYRDRSLGLLGFAPLTGKPAFVSLGVVILVIALVILSYRVLLQKDNRYQWIFVPELLPRNQPELNLFLLLSITAGITEEILYRGYLVWYLNQVFSLPMAVLVASVLFTFAHAYQGKKAMLVIFPVGLMFGILYAYSGSLLAPILLHTAINSYAGIYGKKIYGNDTR